MSERDLLKSALAATPDCLSPEQLEALAARPPADENPHVSHCPRCQAELAMLRAFESNTPLPGEGAAVAWISSDLDRRLARIKNPANSGEVRARSASGSWFSQLLGSQRFRYGVLATACAVILAIGVLSIRSSKEPELRASVAEQSPIYRSGELQVIGPEGELNQVPKTLEWQGFPGARSYRVVLMEVDRSELWSTETPSTSVTIPADVRDKITDSKPILWQVSALSPTGNSLAISSTRRFLFRDHAGSEDSSNSR